MIQRPSKISSQDDLENYYWMKSDLVKFCKDHHLPTQGVKPNLVERIKTYLLTGRRENFKLPKKQGEKDSLQKISKNTPVKNYNNDAKTREFFMKHIGENFKFNAYLRQFTDQSNIVPNMTYNDLIDGWIDFENNRGASSEHHPIPPQFEYNQFIKDFFKHEKKATLELAISAWKILVSGKGPRTYKRFKRNER